ncbi:MAG: hypothetical protein HY290_33395 [Planctomycetia bacterium]|nr:hypothetical protein [Planctomycetia bacterium]
MKVFLATLLVLAAISINASSFGQGESKKPMSPDDLVRAAPLAVEIAPGARKLRYSFVVDGTLIEWVKPSAQPQGEDATLDEELRIVRIDDSSLNQILHGNAATDESVCEVLSAELHGRIEALDQACQLTDVQKRKLTVAGRGDIRRFIHRVDDLRRKYQSEWVDESDFQARFHLVRQCTRESQPLRRVSIGGEFLADSIYVKTLRNCLTADQSTRLISANLRSTAVVTHSGVLRPKVQMMTDLE